MTENFDEFILRLEELQILFNILYKKGNNRFKLTPYLLEETLYRISLNDSARVNLNLSKEEYYNIMEEQELFQFPDIFPKYGIIRSSLIGSGFLKMSNWDEIKKKLNDIKSVDPLKGQRYTFIGMDTNCFMNRIYSVIQHEYMNDITNFYFVLSKIVQDELLSTRRIPNTQLNELKSTFPDKEPILSEFWNGDTLRTRKRRIGLVEFNKLRTYSKCLTNEGILVDDEIDMDVQILQDFKKQILSQHYNLLLLSSDEQIAQQAQTPGVFSYYLTLTPLDDLPTQYKGKWDMIYDLIYLSAIYFGAVSLRGNHQTVQLFGLWRGKGTKDWDLEAIKVRIGSTDLANELAQQLSIIRSI
jgi:hypothetical protein